MLFDIHIQFYVGYRSFNKDLKFNMDKAELRHFPYNLLQNHLITILSRAASWIE